MSRRIVVDTNVYVSRFIRPVSIPGLAVVKAVRQDQTLISLPIWMELRTVLHRPKFSRFTRPGLLEPYLNDVWMAAQSVVISTPIRACRDPKDDKFLEVAVHGRADAIVTGDRDLLVLNPFRGIAILTPAAYLELQ
jgi:putative PIN family toxin of toxin-antitoxin system